MPGADHYRSHDAKGVDENGVYDILESHVEVIDPPNETSRLLGETDSDSDREPPARTDSWVGDKEYAHLPWYKRPSVRLGPPSNPELAMELMLTLSWPRCGG